MKRSTIWTCVALLPLAAALLLFAVPAPQRLAAAQSQPAYGHGGAVVSEEAAATRAGLDALRLGGNAVDAAVATALALAVVHPEAGNLGGGGFAVIRMGGELVTLDFRETAPAAAHRDLYLDEDGNQIPEASTVGPLAAGVPGSPAGLHALHERYGALPWAEVVAPAARMATRGFRISTRSHETLVYKRELLERFPETAAAWLPQGAVPAIGDIHRLPALGATLSAYAEHGPEAITTGPVAEAIERASKRHGGILTAADLAAYRPVWRQPVRVEAFGWQLASMDLPSSGGILLGETLGMLEILDWDALPRFGADRAHILAEVWRRAYADRSLLGDPSTSEATAADLLERDWLEVRARGIDPARATPSSQVGTWASETVSEPADTTHLSVVDGDGNMVALTTTLNALFGCGLLVPEAGFFLNNEMDDFAAQPGEPNLYGLVQGEGNAVSAGRRMLSSMTPVIAWRGDEAIAAGGRGGGRIPSATIQVLLNVMADGDDVQAAVGRPRIHHQWMPDQITAEPDALSPETRAELARRGHSFDEARALAHVHVVRRRPDGLVEVGADPRVRALGAVVAPLP